MGYPWGSISDDLSGGTNGKSPFSIQREDVIPKYSLISHPTADRIFVYLKAADQYSTTSSPLRNGRVLKQPF